MNTMNGYAKNILSNNYVLTAAGGHKSLKTGIETASNLGWTSKNTDDFIIPTVNTLAYWNGAYTGTSSNLQYCAQGRFGDIVTKNIATLKIPDNQVIWGTAGLSGGTGPVAASLCDPLRGNRFACIKAEAVTIEYSTDAGANWVDYEATDAQKRNLFTLSSVNLVLGKNTDKTTDNDNYRLRITVDSNIGNVYTGLRKAILYVSTSGSTESKVIVLVSNDNSTYTDMGTYSLGGLSGYNEIPLNFTADPQARGTDKYYRYIRFLFSAKYKALTGNHFGLTIINIEVFGGVGWNVPNPFISKYGRPYTYDYDGHSRFCGSIFPDSNNVLTLGTSNKKWKAVYAASFYGQASHVICSKATTNTNRPIVITNESNLLFYTTKATINYSTGNITAPTFTGTATKVVCDAASSNNDRPIVGTNKSNELYYTDKVTVNWETGNVTAPTFTGKLVGDADTVGGYTIGDLFTSLTSEKDNKLSITIGEITKTLTTLYASYLTSIGSTKPQSGRTQAYGDVYSYNTGSETNEGAPSTYTSVIGFGRGTSGTVEIAGGWTNSMGLWYRSLRDTTDDWYSWVKVLDSSNSSVSGGGSAWGSSITVEINGTSKTLTIPSNPNTDAKVKQAATTTSNFRPIVLGYNNSTDFTTLDDTETTNLVYVTLNLYANPNTGALYAGLLTITNTEASPHINFSRASYNYINAPKDGIIAIVPDGGGQSSAAGYYFDGTSFYAGTTNARTLGKSAKEWKGVYTKNLYVGYDSSANKTKLVINSDGKIYPAEGYRNAGMYGVYDSTKVGLIWSMGTSYSIKADGSSTNSLYGLAYFHTNWSNSATYNATTRTQEDGTTALITPVSSYAGNHQVAWCINGVVYAALGTYVWSKNGFKKKDSSNDYVLLGGGGHKALSDFAAGTVTSITLTQGDGITISNSGTAITTSGTRTITNAGVRSTTINGDFLRVNTNGTDADLTIPYATKASYLITEGDTRTEDTIPNNYSNEFIFRGLKNNTVIDYPSTDTYSYLLGLRGWSDNSGGNSWELAFNNSGINVRNGATTYWNNWEKLAYTSNLSNVAYGTCSTAAGTAAKVIDLSSTSSWELKTGSIIVIKFTYTNTASNPTFNVDSTGNTSIWYNTAVITSSNKDKAGTANRPSIYMYDGTNFVFLGWSYDTNSTYTNYTLGLGHGICLTAESTTEKVVTLVNYNLSTGGIVSVIFSYNVPANSTMNINSKGAKDIYYRGSKIPAGIIHAGDTATFIYNGTLYHLISIDKSVVTTAKYGYMSASDKVKLDGIYPLASSVNFVLKLDSGEVLGTLTINDEDVDLFYYDTTYEAATSDTLGLIKIGYTQSGKNYPVKLDANNRAYVNVPWDSGTSEIYYGTVTEIETGIGLTGGPITDSGTISANLKNDKKWNIASTLPNSIANNRLYSVSVDSSGYLCTAVPWISYTFTGGTNQITITPSIGESLTITINPSISNNITGSGLSGYLAKFSGTNTITKGPQLGSNETTFLRNDGTWATPTDNKVALTESTTHSGSYFYPAMHTGTGSNLTSLQTVMSFVLHDSTATSTTYGYTCLTLGNTAETAAAGSKYGMLRLFGHAGSQYDLRTAEIVPVSKTSYNIYLPNKSGTIALISDIPTITPSDNTYSESTTSGNVYLTGTTSTTDGSTVLKFYTKFYVNSTGVYWTSDRKFKKNIISPVKSGLLEDETGFIRKFDWKDTGKTSYGYIAQELLKLIPEAVDYDEKLNKYSVNYDVAHSAAIALLVIKIKELESEIKYLKLLIN